ncbi:hypothetical protein PGT21_033935 [Puccinia graminis f. sp. tritici]|uniref:Uncharacterized protein n=1 Tax=Puccinia graminis f. sp. tritici TaxID=56615 RepID=A0A5B0MQN1_PUCGR|nr:hypothetical protein PGT21_033935 [Puccinia graminis f. sp. tritici]KAA1109817.1 hypothetical protein PGTUg99_035439 [Puccinia graminis f. sp. tritici]
MSSESSLSGSHDQTKIPSSFGHFRRSLALSLTLAVILTSLFYLLAPKLIRKYARRFKIGQIGFLSLKDLEWTSSHQNISTKHQDGFTTDEDQSDQNEGIKITVKSIGLRLGSNEGSRRQWIALRIDSPRIRIPKRRTRSNSFDSSSESFEPEFSSAAETSYRYGRSRKISGASSTSQLSGLSKTDALPLQFLKTLSHKSKQATSSILRHLPAQAHPILRFLRKLLHLARLEIVRPLLNKLNRFGRRLLWIISVFGVEVNNINVNVIKTLQIHKLTTIDDTDPSEEDIKRGQTAQDTTAAFSFPGCIEISASAGLDPVIGLASIWAGCKAAGYTRRFPSSPYQNHPSNMPNGSWKRYIRPRSVNVTLKISEDLQASRRTSKKTSLSPNLKASSAFISIENALAITHALPNRTKTNESNGPSISILSDEPIFSSSNFSHLEESQNSPSKVFSTLSIIRQFQISLPSLHCYYILAGPISTPISTSTSSPGAPTTQNKKIAIDLQITRFIMNLDLSAEKTGKEAS